MGWRVGTHGARAQADTSCSPVAPRPHRMCHSGAVSPRCVTACSLWCCREPTSPCTLVPRAQCICTVLHHPPDDPSAPHSPPPPTHTHTQTAGGSRGRHGYRVCVRRRPAVRLPTRWLQPPQVRPRLTRLAAIATPVVAGPREQPTRHHLRQCRLRRHPITAAAT